MQLSSASLCILLLCNCISDESPRICPAGFDRFCDRCYTIVKSPTTWDGARAGCTALNANLVTIRNSEEQSCITDYVKTAGKSSYLWIGLHKATANAVWTWSSGGPVSNFYNWNPGERCSFSPYSTVYCTVQGVGSNISRYSYLLALSWWSILQDPSFGYPDTCNYAYDLAKLWLLNFFIQSSEQQSYWCFLWASVSLKLIFRAKWSE